MPDALAILVVCTANICRSPAAQAVFQHRLLGHPCEIGSTGTQAASGQPMDAAMQGLLRQRGLDPMTTHRSTPFTLGALRNSQLILTMEHHHLQQVLQIDPTLRAKTKLLGHWDRTEILDPHGGTPAQYAQALTLIERAVDAWVGKLGSLGLMA